MELLGRSFSFRTAAIRATLSVSPLRFTASWNEIFLPSFPAAHCGGVANGPVSQGAEFILGEPCSARTSSEPAQSSATRDAMVSTSQP